MNCFHDFARDLYGFTAIQPSRGRFSASTVHFGGEAFHQRPITSAWVLFGQCVRSYGPGGYFSSPRFGGTCSDRNQCSDGPLAVPSVHWNLSPIEFILRVNWMVQRVIESWPNNFLHICFYCCEYVNWRSWFVNDTNWIIFSSIVGSLGVRHRVVDAMRS